MFAKARIHAAAATHTLVAPVKAGWFKVEQTYAAYQEDAEINQLQRQEARAERKQQRKDEREQKSLNKDAAKQRKHMEDKAEDAANLLTRVVHNRVEKFEARKAHLDETIARRREARQARKEEGTEGEAAAS